MFNRISDRLFEFMDGLYNMLHCIYYSILCFKTLQIAPGDKATVEKKLLLVSSIWTRGEFDSCLSVLTELMRIWQGLHYMITEKRQVFEGTQRTTAAANLKTLLLMSGRLID